VTKSSEDMALRGEEARATVVGPQPVSRPAVARTYDWPALISAALIIAVNVSVITGFRLPFLLPAIGFWFLLIHPAYLLCTTSVWRGSAGAERLGYSVTATLLILMLSGLALNTFLPFLGIRRPLDPVPVVLLGDAITLALYLFRRRHPAKVLWRAQIRAIHPAENRLIIGSVICVVLAVLGANRLNNGAGDRVSLFAEAGMVLVLSLLLLRQREVREGVTCVILYLVSLALLLMTSLRGWYVTGHDIQQEYGVFQLAETHGHWNIGLFRNAYNACLSITILPTEVSRVVQVDNPYVYKVFFQALFALCPVLVYTIARRYWSRPIAILATVYFIGFPTFFTDMPFLNRQEIAYLFVCVAILAITNVEWSLRRRQATLLAAALGIELSHYSTMYIFLATVTIAWVAQNAGVLRRRLLRRPVGQAQMTARSLMAQTVSIGTIIVFAALAFAWGDLATQTANGAVTAAESAVTGLFRSNGVKSNDVAYSILGGNTVSPQAVLNAYSKEASKLRAGSSASTYVPGSVLARYPIRVVKQPSLPVAGAGLLLSHAGIPVSAFNSAVRLTAAKGEQLFASVGLITLIAVRPLREKVSRDFIFLCVGSLGTLAIITILPNLSVDYGVLRAFQEALILIAPVLVAGSLTAFSPLGRVWAPRVAAAVCIGIFTSTTGLLPQVLGGYPAQLNLNNSGAYYQIYYMHPQEEAATAWLRNQRGAFADGVQASYETRRFSLDVQQPVTDIFPPLVRQSSWAIVGYSTLHTSQATSMYNGNALYYAYPIGILQDSKNLVYNNGGAEIYK
jgi:uncharacterized membrane protein